METIATPADTHSEDGRGYSRIDEVPKFWAARSPSAPALVEAGHTITYGGLVQSIQDARLALSNCGVQRGHRVLLVAENCVPLVSFLFAACELDATFILVNARLSSEEVDAVAAHAEAQAEVYLDAGQRDAVVHGDRRGATVVACGTLGAVRIRVAAQPTVQEEGLAGVAAMIFTSGTTGKPKGVMLTHGNLLFVAQTMAASRELSPRDRSYGVLPMSHTMGLTSMLLSSLVVGGSVILSARFNVEALVRALEKEQVTLFQGVQAMYAGLLNHLRATGHALKAPQLRYIYAGGSPLDPTLKRETEVLFGLPLHNGYGMTESAPTICHTRMGEHRDDSAVGPPIPGVSVRIVDSNGLDVPVGTPGELWMQGPGVMKGYFRDAAATAAAMADGWLRTGDLAQQDDKGDVFIVGRIKEVIIRSGFNVYPAEVEAAINAHDAVRQCAVVGRIVGANEEVVAFVELKPQCSLDRDDLIAFLKKKISPYKRPSQIVYMDALPVMSNGKIRKAALKVMAVDLARLSR